VSELKQLRLEMRKRRHIAVSDQWQLAQRGIARPLCLLLSDRESASHETLFSERLRRYGDGRSTAAARKRACVHAAIPTALSAARTDHTKPLSDCSGLTGSGYSREEPSARKTHARICEGGVGQPAPLLENGRYEFLKQLDPINVGAIIRELTKIPMNHEAPLAA